MKKKNSLPVRILIALFAGIAVGLICYFAGWADFTAAYLKPFGDIFVNLLKFIVVPVVLLSMIDGILSMGDMKQVGSVGVKTVAYFLVTTAIACVIGLVFANIFWARACSPTSPRSWARRSTSPRRLTASCPCWWTFSPATCGAPLSMPTCSRSL